ncbi:MAG: hypothetical protein U5K51_11280 [Flavobacteriaceae bacterium]|nr:hypothetical protein [Flavobacteriaceae bacterium]
MVELLATIGVPLAFAFSRKCRRTVLAQSGAREHWNSAIYPIHVLGWRHLHSVVLCLLLSILFTGRDKNELYKENVAILGKIVLALLLPLIY